MSFFEQMDSHAESIPIAKLVLHVLQMVLGFIAWALGIAVFRADGAEVNANNGWTFGVVCRVAETVRKTGCADGWTATSSFCRYRLGYTSS